MLSCCWGTPSSFYAPMETGTTTTTSSTMGGGGISAFPGRRRATKAPYQYQGQDQKPELVNTGGNALQAYDPSMNQAGGGGGEIVSVTVPDGVYGGQSIQVSAPDGSGRIISAVVPQGMQPGSTFMVQFPAIAAPICPPVIPSTAYNPSHDKQQEQPIVAIPVMDDVKKKEKEYDFLSSEPITATLVDDKEEQPIVATPIINEHHQLASESPPTTQQQQQQRQPFHLPPLQIPSSSQPQQRMMLVHIPPGTVPGSTLMVQPPGEQRAIAAVVPPNVTQFQLAYYPTVSAAPSYPSQAPSHPQQQLPMNSNRNTILVQVPPGTAPGSTLHVPIPGEERVVAAVVPPGVSQFRVAYPPQQRQGGPVTTGVAPLRMNNQNQGRPMTGGRPVPTWGQNGGQSSNPNGMNNGNNGGGGGRLSSVAPMIAGAALMAGAGAVGYSMMHHDGNYQNSEYDQGNYEQGNYEQENTQVANYDDGGDYGGNDDYADDGGFDDGGGDFDCDF